MELEAADRMEERSSHLARECGKVGLLDRLEKEYSLGCRGGRSFAWERRLIVYGEEMRMRRRLGRALKEESQVRMEGELLGLPV